MTSSRPALAVLAALAGLSAAAPASAHRQWVLPSTAQVEGENAYVTFDAAVSEGLFDFDTVPLQLAGLVVTGPDGQAVAPENLNTGKRRSSFDLKLDKPGTYRASVVSTSVMASYMLGGEQKRWRGTEADLTSAIPAGAEDVRITRTEARVESFVTKGEPTATALAPIGKGLELVPLTHPTDLLAGTPARFRALIDGKPAPDLDITVVPGGGRFRAATGDVSLKADAAGEVTVSWPMPGRYWVGASWPRREDTPAAAPAVANGNPPAAPTPRPVQPPRRLTYAATFEVAPF
ncbi:MAG: DUF4198 domain-containing protein [Pseudomonadota bacterium]|jgi:uncharacterized GH25 family protein